MNYRNSILYRRFYLPRVRQKLLDLYLDAIREGRKPVFIHINKTAGSSIAQSLGITEGHYTLEDIERAYVKRFQEPIPTTVEVIAAIRNPFDKLVSQYSYRTATNQNRMGKFPLDFNQWIIEVFEKKNPKYRDRELMFVPQTQWLRSETPRNIQYIRFEKLHEDVAPLLQKYGERPLSWKKRSSHKPYREYYNERSKEIIQREFESDLKAYNYQF